MNTFFGFSPFWVIFPYFLTAGGDRNAEFVVLSSAGSGVLFLTFYWLFLR